MPAKSGTHRDLGLRSTGAGKGDVERSSGWRDKYDEVEWTPKGIDPTTEGFKVVSNRLRKTYPAQPQQLGDAQPAAQDLPTVPEARDGGEDCAPPPLRSGGFRVHGHRVR